MDNYLLWLGRAAGIGGVVLLVVAAAVRLSGKHWVAGFEALTLLQAGIAGMMLGCLCFLTLLVQRSDNT